MADRSLYDALKALCPPLTVTRQWEDSTLPDVTETLEISLPEVVARHPDPVVWLWLKSGVIREGDNYAGWDVYGPPLHERPELKPLLELALRSNSWTTQWNDPYGIHERVKSVLLLELPREAVAEAFGLVSSLERVRQSRHSPKYLSHRWILPNSRTLVFTAPGPQGAPVLVGSLSECQDPGSGRFSPSSSTT